MAPDAVEQFITRWKSSGAAERANHQLFITELCDVLGVPRPDPATPDDDRNAYVFERAVRFTDGTGHTTVRFIDLYKRGCFVLEAKQGVEKADHAGGAPLSKAHSAKSAGKHKGTATRGTASWDVAMLRARGQAEQYIRALPPAEGRPPFLVVMDVGHSIELYAEFSCTGGAYTPFPSAGRHRVFLDDLRKEEVRDLLRNVWTAPLELDPARRSARVTRDIAERLARLAASLEQRGRDPHTVAAFLMRCLFTMFAEDVWLLPRDGFTNLLAGIKDTPEHFAPLIEELWNKMNTGGFSTSLRLPVLQFNGGLFADPTALPLDRDQLELLIEAARCDWRDVEPAIFGTLLERALDPVERHKLGAHYTPRAYVERLVLEVVVSPLRAEWQAVQAAAVSLAQQDRRDRAVRELRTFHRRLCELRILDPACGTGNFLYVAYEHLKHIEAEVFDALRGLGHGQLPLEMPGQTVYPNQFLGLEVNPRAAAIAELVLWIGALQWHYRTRDTVRPPQPIIRDFRNIECRDAVLEWDRTEPLLDDDGKPRTRWDGRTFKPHPVTGLPVPDENAREPLVRYIDPRPAVWPETDFVVGNPPFIGAARMRDALGDGYVDALRRIHAAVPDSADFVMLWWDHAAELARRGAIRRFGFVTTNSLRQKFNRRVLDHHLRAKPPLSIVYAVPDHPWVDGADGADVRIAMTAAEKGERSGMLQTVTAEQSGHGDGYDVVLRTRTGRINPDLTIGPDLSAATALAANSGLSCPGVKLHGSGFIVSPEQARSLGLGRVPGLDRHIRPYRNGRDLTQHARGVMVIDLYGLEIDDVRDRFPEVYQWLLERVKPERDQNNRRSYREKWWIFGEPRGDFRPALEGLDRYIATVETSKHRFFVFLDAAILPDNKLIAIASNDAGILGVLSSRVHTLWTMTIGSRIGVGNDPVYVKTTCFEQFPFPVADSALRDRVRDLAERIDAHRRQRKALHPELTLTALYNVLEKARAGRALSDAERTVYEHGLVAVLGELHDELDRAVFAAYGWDDLAECLVGRPGALTPMPDKPAEIADAEQELLARLLALNAERVAEEQRGVVRWLRPEFQAPDQAATQPDLDISVPAIVDSAQSRGSKRRRAWPKRVSDQVQALLTEIEAVSAPIPAADLARRFLRAPTDTVADLLDTLAALGRLHRLPDGRYEAG